MVHIPHHCAPPTRAPHGYADAPVGSIWQCDEESCARCWRVEPRALIVWSPEMAGPHWAPLRQRVTVGGKVYGPPPSRGPVPKDNASTDPTTEEDES